MMDIKNKPKKDGSGQGKRKNKGRSGCKKTKKVGQGRNKWNHKQIEIMKVMIVFKPLLI